MKKGMVAVVAIALTVLAVPALADTLEDLKRRTQQGDAPAQGNLGAMYYEGRGVLKDVVLAHMWFNIASANGPEEASKIRDSLERQMSRVEIARANALARKCMASEYKTCGQ